MKNYYRVDDSGTQVEYLLQLRRTGAAFKFNADGTIGDVNVARVLGPRPDVDWGIPVHFRVIGGATPTTTQGLSCFGYLSAYGNLTIESGVPNSYVGQWATSSGIEWSVVAHVQFSRRPA